jgi:hypothetical protein
LEGIHSDEMIICYLMMKGETYYGKVIYEYNQINTMHVLYKQGNKMKGGIVL